MVVVLVGVDYLVWTWSLGGHSTAAIVSGMAFTPLLIATLWLAAVQVARALNRPHNAAAGTPSGRHAGPSIRPGATPVRRGVLRLMAWAGARRRGTRAAGSSAAKSSQIPA